MSLGDFFPEDLKQKFAERNVDIGQSILIKIKTFNVNYDKYIILIAVDNQLSEFGAVIINSEINENVFPTSYLQSLHIEIDVANHPFLEINSFVNCSEIKSFPKQQLIDFLKSNPERLVGNITQSVLKKIHLTLMDAKTITIIEKRRYGLI
jgi:hypothetical protein